MRLFAALIVAALAAPALADDGPTIGETVTPDTPKVAVPSATRPAATLPATVPENRGRLFEDPKTGGGVIPMSMPATDSTGPGTVEAVGPAEPKVKFVLEGTVMTKRVVRLTKDEKSGGYLVSFDSDGNQMRDPPMIALPSKALAAMEDLSVKGTRPVRFQITGTVTEYKGKNYILIHSALALRDLNTGLGGG
jgi:hypothetical protein